MEIILYNSELTYVLCLYIILKRKIKVYYIIKVTTQVNDQIQNEFHIVIFTHFYTDCIKWYSQYIYRSNLIIWGFYLLWKWDPLIVWDESNAQIAINTGASTDWKMTHYFTSYSWDSGHSWPFPRQNYLEFSIASLSVLLIGDWTNWLFRYSNFVIVMIPRYITIIESITLLVDY